MDTPSNRQIIPIKRNWQLFATWNVKKAAEGIRMQCRLEYFPEKKQDVMSQKVHNYTRGRKKKHSHRKPCHGALFSYIWLFSIIISIPKQQEFQS